MDCHEATTHLRSLRKRLARLRRRRQRFRWATAASALAIAVLWALAGVFALDWYFQRNVDLLQRLLLLGLAAAGVIWAFVRFALPWLGKHEDVTDMALLVAAANGHRQRPGGRPAIRIARRRALGLAAVGNGRDRPRGRRAEETST